MIKDFYNLIDLTHPLSPNMPTWNGSCGFHLEVKKDYDQVFCVHQIKMHAGASTHMDAPSHRFKDGHSISEISIENLIVPVCVMNVSQQAHPDYEISVADVTLFENQYGTIPKKSLVIGYTGWDRFWNDPLAYRNPDENGLMHFPSFSEQAAEYLLEKGISGIGIDTLSPDAPRSDFPVHRLLLGAGLYIIENIAQGSKLPPQGAEVIALPLKAEGASEAPIRLIGLTPIRNRSTKALS